MLCAALTLLSARSEAAVVEDRAYFPPVLIYHDIKAQVVMEGFDVSLDEFRNQLDWLKSHGWRTLTAEEFVGYIERREAFPKKTVLLTFDDAYGGIYRYAAPELSVRDMSAVFFVIVDAIGKPLSRDYWHASLDELQSMAAEPHFSMQSHTVHHVSLDQVSESERQSELLESKAALEKMFGESIKLLAYPCGDYDASVIDDVIDAGYAAAFIVDVLDKGDFDRAMRFSIPRINMGVVFGAEGRRAFQKFMRRYARLTDKKFADQWARLPH